MRAGVALLGAGATGLYKLLCYEPSSKAQDVNVTISSNFVAVVSGTEYGCRVQNNVSVFLVASFET